MRYSRSKPLFAGLLIFFANLLWSSTITTIPGTINGPTVVCSGAEIQYSYPYIDGYSYTWGVQNGTGTSLLNPDSTLNLFNVSWQTTESDTAFVSLIVTDNTGTTDTLLINILIESQPTPLILSDFNSDCVHLPDSMFLHGDGNPDKPRRLDECQTVCEGLAVNYTTQNFSGHTYEWQVIGDYQSLLNANTNTATVIWDTPGFAYVVVTESIGNDCEWSDTICIEIIDKPISSFDSQMGATTYSSASDSTSAITISTCLNSEICFSETASGEVSYFWDFGDGNTSTEASPCHIFNTPGINNVTLIVYNECSCSDTSYINIDVEDQEGPSIICKNMLCESSQASYSAEFPSSITPCVGAVYEWSVSANGTITGQTGSVISSTSQSVTGENIVSIDVDWGTGPVGSISLSVSGCADICDQATTIEVPIVPSTMQIEGDSVLCSGEDGYYSLPCLPGTKYSWFLNGVPQPNSDHDYWINFNSPGTYNITVNYYNDLLGCDGSTDTFTIMVSTEASLIGPSTICEGDVATFLASTGATYLWEITDNSGTVISSTTTGGSYTTPASLTAGSYFLTVKDVGTPVVYCNELSQNFTVVPAPPAPTAFSGDLFVCDGEISTYTAIPASSDYYLVWDVFNNGVTTSYSGNSISVVWEPGPKTISLSHYAVSGDCPSLPFVQTINNKPLPSGVAILGPDTVCANTTLGSEELFSTNQLLDGYAWSLTPNDAGSITSGSDTDVISTLWNNYGGTATISLSPILCGDTLSPPISHTVEVIPFIPMDVSGPDTICQNTVNSWTASFSSGVGSSFSWEILDPLSSAVIATGSGSTATYDFENESGNYVLIYTAYGPNCNAPTVVSYPIFVHPYPVGNLSFTGQTQCVEDGTGVDFFLSVSGASPYTYTWYQSGSIISGVTGTTHSIPGTISSAGTYGVIITDANNCSNISNPIIVDTCKTDTCDYLPPGTVSFTYSLNPDCQTVNYTPTITGTTPTGYLWNFGQLGTSNSTSPSFTFPASGNYETSLTVFYGGADTCSRKFNLTTIVPVISNYELGVVCEDFGYSFNLINTSDVVNGPLSMWNHQWSITPASGGSSVVTGTTQDINGVTTLTSGEDYVVNLEESLYYTFAGQTVNAYCLLTDTFTVPDSLHADFNLPASRCEEIALPFTDASSGNIVNWVFDFGDASSMVNQNTEKTYDNAGTYSVTLTVSDEYGCSDTVSKPITILPNLLDGTLSTDVAQPMCPDTATVTFNNMTSPSSAPYSYLWNNGSTGTSITSSESENHSITVTDTYGCVNTFGPITTQVLNVPEPIISGAGNFCLNEPFTVFANYGSGYSYSWFGRVNGAPFTAVGTNSPSFTATPPFPGVYELYVVISDGTCSNTSTILEFTIDATPAPIILPSSIPVCPNDSVELTVTNSSNFIQVNWSNGTTGNTTIVGSAGLYVALGTDSSGCEAQSSFTVEPLPDFCGFICGCYDDCIPDGGSYSFPAGVMGSFALWRWEIYDGTNWVTYANGSGTVPDFTTSIVGNYTIRLYLEAVLGCGAYSCETDLNLVSCDSDDCEVNHNVKNVECAFDGDVVTYDFELNVGFADFGAPCPSGYQMTVTSPFGNITPFTSSVTAGAYQSILTNWNTGMTYFPAGTVCLDVTLMNTCDSSICTFTTCFEVPDCGSLPPDCETNFGLTFSECKTDTAGNIIYFFTLTNSINAFGTPCTDYNLTVSPTFGTVTLASSTVASGTSTVTGTWNTGTSVALGGATCFNVQVMNSCDQSTCKNTVCADYPPCGSTKPCLENASIKITGCKIDDKGNVTYNFNVIGSLFSFGATCSNYSLDLIPSFGFVNLSSTSVAPNTSFNISGVWNTTLSALASGTTCFDLILTNNCDETTCETEVCFEYPPCGDDVEPCLKNTSIKITSCKSDKNGNVVYTFDVVGSLFSFGSNCDDYSLNVNSPYGTVNLSTSAVNSNTSFVVSGEWNTNLSSLTAGTECFDVIITNKCDETTCEKKVCFEHEGCEGETVGIDKSKKRKNLFVFPNPASDHVNISFASPDTYDVSVINTRGQVIRHYSIQAQEGDLHLLDLNQLPSGVYLIKTTGSIGTSSDETVLLR